MAIKKEIEIVANTEKAQKNIKDLNKELSNTKKGVEDSKKAFEQGTSTIDKFTGGAISKFKSLTSTLGSVATGFKGIGTAIALSGIGLLVTVIGSVIAAFKSSEEGQNKFAKLMGVIGSVVGNVVDVISDLGELIIGVFSGDSQAIKSATSFGKKFFDVVGLPIKSVIDLVKTASKVLGSLLKGDIDGAFDNLQKGALDIKNNFTEAVDAITDAKDAVVGFGKEIQKDAVSAAKIADQRAQADKIERDLIVERAEANRKRAELLEKAQQRDKYNQEERIKLLQEAGKIEEDITNKEKQAAQLRFEAKALENSLSKSTKEDLKEEEELKANVLNLETARLQKQKEVTGQIAGLKEQENASYRAATEAQKAELEKQAEAEKKRLNDILSLQEKFKDQQDDLNAKTEEEKLNLERQRAQEELDLLVGTETEKREAQLALNAYYDQKEKELKEQTEKEKTDLIIGEERKRQEFALETRLADAETEQERLEIEREQIDQRRLYLDEDLERGKISQEEYTTQKMMLDQMITDNEEAQNEQRRQSEESLQNAKVQLAGIGLDIIGSLAKKGSAVAKGIAAAQATINTFQGVTAALSAVSTIPDPFGSILKFANAAAVGVAGAINVKKILSTKDVETKAPSLSGGGGGSAPAPPSFNLVSGTNTNQIAESIQSQSQPIEAYVVSGNVTSAQSLDRNAVETASI